MLNPTLALYINNLQEVIEDYKAGMTHISELQFKENIYKAARNVADWIDIEKMSKDHDKQEAKEVCKCPKCGDEISEDSNEICGRCVTGL